MADLPAAGRRPRFAFLVHPLTGLHRRIVGIRRADPAAAVGLLRPTPPGALCELGIEGRVEGVVVAIQELPETLLTDQQRALESMVEAVAVAGDVQAVGLGSLLAVVAGRGVALSERVSVPITTGAAATTWAAVENAAAVLEAMGERRAAVLGFAGAVGEAVAAELCRRGYEVIAGGQGKAQERQARKLGVTLRAPEAAVADARVVIGASTTGGILDPGALSPGCVLLDIAMPPTLRPGPRPPGVRVLAGEAVALPAGWQRGFWGHLYHVLAGYGPGQIFACLAEPMVMAIEGRERPFALGRRVESEDLRAFGEAAARLSLRPRLVRGWREVPVARLIQESP